MDISRDHVRRELGELGRAHDHAMKQYNEALDRMVNEGDLSEDEQDHFILGGLNRRRFLTIGGVSIASAAIFAACGSSSKSSSGSSGTSGTKAATTTAPTTTPMTTTTTTAPASSGAKGTATDITILRTASSLEYLAVATYEAAIKSGLVTSSAVAAAAKDFMEQHAEHAAAFVAATTKAGGKPYTKPNPVIDKAVIAPALPKLKNQTDVLQLAWTLENAAAETYVSTVGKFDNAAYNPVAASIAGVESRHMTVIGGVLASTKYPTYVPGGFFTTTGAVKPGTGV